MTVLSAGQPGHAVRQDLVAPPTPNPNGNGTGPVDQLDPGLRAPAPTPLVDEGEYDAYAQSAAIVNMKFGSALTSVRLVVTFEIRGGRYDGMVLRFFAPLPPRRGGRFVRAPAPSSKFYRSWIIANLGHRPTRGDRLSLEVFRLKLFRIRVRTVCAQAPGQGGRERPLPRCLWYSVVDEIVERIA
jgi:hypothetical protein